MKLLFLAIATLLLAANAAAEECIAKTPSYDEEGSYAVETCTARVDDVIRTTVDGYVAQHYIVQYKGQRLVVFDPGHSDHTVGDQVSFTVMKLEQRASSRSRGFRALLAQTWSFSESSSDKSQP